MFHLSQSFRDERDRDGNTHVLNRSRRNHQTTTRGCTRILVTFSTPESGKVRVFKPNLMAKANTEAMDQAILMFVTNPTL